MDYHKLPGKNWGTEVVPPEDRIDITKKYRTRNGKEVVCLDIKLNSDDNTEYTFPIKGSIVIRKKPLSIKYCIWTLDGRKWLNKPSGDDLILVEGQ